MANVLLVSFTIHWGQDDDAYDQIYEDLNTALQSAPVSKYWCETTSFYCVQTTENSRELVSRLVSTSGLRSSKDRLLVVDANVKTGTAWGNIRHADLYALLPFVKKL